MADVSPTRLDDEASDEPGPDALPSGTRVGRYAVSSLLGRGGMGRVYEAWDLRLERRIALKVLRPDVFAAGRDGQLRLLREARALARVTHPNVVPVFDVGRYRGRVWVAMEHVQGETLRTFIATPRPWREVLDVFVLVARGLQAVHEMGLVHRDFKPGNVILGSDGRPRVMDFGLARGGVEPTAIGDREDTFSGPFAAASVSGRFSSGDPLETSLTAAGTVVGTPPYMAPEQHGGALIDARADQYAFCVALWEALYQERPFRGDDADALARAKAAGPPEAPADRDIPRWLVQCLRRGLSTRPDARFSSMRELVLVLERAGKSPRRHLAWFAVGAALVGVAAFMRPAARSDCARGATPVDAVWDSPRADALAARLAGSGRPHAAGASAHLRARGDAWVAAWREAYLRSCEDPTPSAAVRDCLDRALEGLRASVGALERADPDAALEAASAGFADLPPPEECRDATADGSPPPAPADALDTATIRARLATAEAHGRLGEFPTALENARLALELARRLEHPSLVAESLVAVGKGIHATGDPSAAMEQIRQAAWMAESNGDDAVVASATVELVRILATSAPDFDEADRWARVGAAAIERAGLGETVRIRLVHSIAVLDLQRDALDRADAGFREILAYEEAKADRDPVRVAFAMEDVARAAARRGDLVEARALSDGALALLEQELGPQHPEIAEALIFAGGLATAAGELETSIALHRRALEIRTASFDPGHPAIAHALGPLAYVLGMHGDLQEALPLQERELSILEAALGPDHPDCGFAHGGLGITFDQLDRHEEAAMHMRRALEIAEATIGPTSAPVATAHNNLAIVLEELGRPDDARAHYERSIEIHEAILGPDHPELEKAVANLAWLDHQAGNDVGAREKLERAVALLDVPGRPDDRELVGLLLDLAELSLDGGDDVRAQAAIDRALALGVEKIPPADQPRVDELCERLGRCGQRAWVDGVPAE